VTCAGCGYENRAGRKFCTECGAALPLACAACGARYEGGERFCGECGTPLAASGARPAPPASPGPTTRSPSDGGERKVVTIIFADLAGSTALQERLDAESVQRLMARYYAALRAAVESHGGTVVKLLGDGVMAAFGLRRVAEDDALRAVRAAVAMQDAFRVLTASQPALADAGLRVGVNTGEVVVSGALDDVVGDPVNVAARLQEKARNGDVVVGEATRRLVATRVTLAPLGSVALKGRAEAVAAHRVESLEPPAGVVASPFVGRDDELARLRAVYDAAVAAPAARLAVLLGSPGLGKSRLIDELAGRVGDAATRLTAHCDAAGGATFAPVAAALRRHLGIEDAASPEAQRAAIEAALDTAGAGTREADEADRARIAGGVAALCAGSTASPEETFYVVRRFLAALAQARPMVLVIDDLHWAEPLLLDLVEHLVQWGAGVPLFVLVGARSELRDLRSSLAVPGGLVSEVVTLGGLDAGAAMRHAANVIGATDLPAAVAAKVLAASEGNPLFVAELVRMLVEEGALTKEGDRWVASAGLAAIAMPPTIHALLAARIERLRSDDRTVLERAAVVGRHFSRGAVAALLATNGAGLADRDAVELDARLESLRRSELIERDSGWLLGEPILRFHHVLIRDAAYRRLLKGTRAELHERLADWIEGQVGDAAEHDETVGWHLEQAHQHLRELGPLDAHAKALGERAATRLAAAGRRALARDDVPLAAGLLGRAIGRVEADAPTRADLALDWCEALVSAGDVGPAGAAIAELERLAADSARLRGWHTCFAAQLAVMTAPEELRAAAERVATAARDLAAQGDAAGEAKAHFVHAQALARLGKVGACEVALDEALAAARRAGDRRRANAVLAGAPLAALSGPSPVTRASGRCLDVVRVLRITQGAPAVEAVALACQGILEALRGRSDAARRMLASSRTMVEELGISQRVYEVDAALGRLDLLVGDAAAAARRLRTAYEGLRDLGLGIDAARAAASLGRALLAAGDALEAERITRESERLAGDDLQAAIAWRGVRAEALAARGEHAAAIELAAAAVAIAAATDALLDHADARRALAAAYRAAGRGAEADAEMERALELWEAKGATLLVEQARGTAVVEPAPSPVAPAAGRGRRVRPNAASRGQAAMDAAIAARDLAAIVALHDEAFTEIDHPNGATYGFDGATRSLHHLVQADDPWCRHEPLATLGDTLVLCRRRLGAGGSGSARFDVGAYEDEKLSLLEVDARGRALRQELFGPDRLAEAATRLYERYAASLPDGPDRTRAAAFAATAATVLGWNLTQLPPPDTLFVPDAEARDHRKIGLWSARGVEDIVRHFRALDTVATNVVMSVEELLGIEPRAMLFRRMHSGVDRGGGGRYEREFFFLVVGGADGRIARAEWFDVDQEAAALARFAELTAEAAPPPAPATRRRIRPNRATATDERSAAAIAAGDVAALEALFGDAFEEIHHPTGSTYGRAASLASIERLLRSEGASYRTEPIATLGDALALGRQHVHASGARGHRLDVGEYENEALSLHEVDAQGRYLRHEVFAADRLNEAIVRLYARYAELLPDDGTRAPAAVTARVVAFILTKEKAGDVDELCAPAFETVDHRSVGYGTLSRAEAAKVPESFDEIADDVRFRVDDVLALSPRGLARTSTTMGVWRDGGGPFERTVCALDTFGPDGRLTRHETFDADHEAETLARYDALAGGGDGSRVANAATRLNERFVAAWARRDWDALAALFDGRGQFEDRRRLMQMEGGRDLNLATLRVFFDAPGSRWTITPIATRGDRCALSRMLLEGAVDAEGGDFAIDYLAVDEVGPDGRSVALVLFDLDDLDAARAELASRFHAGEDRVTAPSDDRKEHQG